MKITIDTRIIKKYGITAKQFYLMLFLKENGNIEEELEKFKNKRILRNDNLFDTYALTPKWKDNVMSILLDSENDTVTTERIEELAPKLIAVFPCQKKAGTCHYFRGNKKDITLRLKKFFKIYGNTYTDEELLEAAKNYVDSFNGQYNYMRILKYFICKDEKKIDENGNQYIETVSDLASFIENKDSEDNYSDDWTSSLT